MKSRIRIKFPPDSKVPHESYLYKGLNKTERKLLKNKVSSVLSELPAIIPYVEKLRLILNIRAELGMPDQPKARRWVEFGSTKIRPEN